MDTAILTATALHTAHSPLTLLPPPSIFPSLPPPPTIPPLSTLRTAALGAPAVATQSLPEAEAWLAQQAAEAARDESRARALARVRSVCAAPARRWRLWRRRLALQRRSAGAAGRRGRPRPAEPAALLLLGGGGVLAAVAVAGVALALARGGAAGGAAAWLARAAAWAAREAASP